MHDEFQVLDSAGVWEDITPVIHAPGSIAGDESNGFARGDFDRGRHQTGLGHWCRCGSCDTACNFELEAFQTDGVTRQREFDFEVLGDLGGIGKGIFAVEIYIVGPMPEKTALPGVIGQFGDDFRARGQEGDGT